MNQTYIGIIFILLHSFFDVSFYTICKILQRDNIYSFNEELVFVLLYNFKALILVFIIFLLSNFNGYNINNTLTSLSLNKRQVLLYLTMSIFSSIGFLVFLYGLKSMLITNAISLKYLEQILWVIVGTFILKENLTYIQLKGILISCIGIILIIVDSLHKDQSFYTYCFPLLAALCWTISSSIGKYIVSNKLKIINHMIHYYTFHTLVLIVFTISVFTIKDVNFFELKINLGSYEFLVHILSMSCFYLAMKITNMSLLAPFVYIKLIFSFIIGILFFSETYNILNLCAYILIISGGLKILTNVNKNKT